jgi:lipopolysaccharide transport system permease protein
MRSFSLHPLEIIRSFLVHRKLIVSLTRRDISARYRGSMLGIAWLIVQPLATLLVYTFVFGVIFKARWAGGGDSKAEFALVLFAGLLVFNFFSESLSRAPSLIVNTPSYVKKVVFPLEVLAFVNMGTALFYALVSLGIWLIFYLALFGMPPLTALALPLMIFPLACLILGVSWFLSALGVYIRDIAHVMGLVVTLLMFLSPIFYPVNALPPVFQQLMHLNPLSFVIEQSRNALFWGKLPDPFYTTLYWLACLLIMWLGFAWFQKTRKGFADVL